MYRPTPRLALLGSAIAAAVVGLVIALALQWANVVSNLAQAVAPVLAAAACAAAARRSSGTERRAWALLGGSALAWGLGQVFWTVLVLQGSADLFPSLADIG